MTRAEEKAQGSAESLPKKKSCWVRVKEAFSLTKPGSTPPPWKIILLLYISLFGSAYSITFIFPFLPDMVLYFGYEEEEKGYYAGLVASAMFAGRIFGSYFWGWLSDRKGRKSVLIVSLTLVAITNLSFGFSTSFAWAVITRFFNGLVNGVVSIVKAVVYEVSDSSNQAVGMSVLSLAWGSGVILGPLISGYIANPCAKYPSVFGDSQFLMSYPFFLPGFVALLVTLMPIPIVWFKLPAKNDGPGTVVEIVPNGDLHKKSPSSPKKRSLASNHSLTQGPSHALPIVVLADADQPDGMPAQTSYYSFKGEGELFPQEVTAFDPLSEDISFMDGEEEKEEYQLVYGIGCPSYSLPDVTTEPPKPKAHELYDIPNHQANCDEHDTSAKQLLEASVVTPSEKKGNCLSNSIVGRMLSIREVRLTVSLYCLYSFALVGWDEVFTVWASTKVNLSGLGFNSEQIGKAIGLSSLPLITLQLFVFPKVEGKIGVIKTFAAFNAVTIVVCVGIVCVRPLHDQPDILWPLVMIIMGLEKMAGVSCFSCISILLNNSVEPAMAGSVNGLGMTFTAVGRTLAPTVGGSIFAWSITRGTEIGFPFDVNLVFIMFGLVNLCCAILCAFLPQSLDKQTKKVQLPGKESDEPQETSTQNTKGNKKTLKKSDHPYPSSSKESHAKQANAPVHALGDGPVPSGSLSAIPLNRMKPALTKSVTSLVGLEVKQQDNVSVHSYVGT